MKPGRNLSPAAEEALAREAERIAALGDGWQPTYENLTAFIANLQRAENERAVESIRQGMQKAREAGTRLGAEPLERPAEFESLYGRWAADEITAKEAAALLDVSVSTFRRWCRAWEAENGLPAPAPKRPRKSTKTPRKSTKTQAAGRKRGGQPLERPDDFGSLYDRWDAGEIATNEAMALLGVSLTTFRRWCRAWEAESGLPAPAPKNPRNDAKARILPSRLVPHLRIAVCDGDAESRAGIADALTSWKGCERVTVERFADGAGLVKAHAGGAFDVVLLDPASDMEAARSIRLADDGVELVFMSSTYEFAHESCQLRAGGYLLKPADPEALLRCMVDLVERMLRMTPWVSLRSNHGFRRVRASEIESISTRNRGTTIVLAGGEVIRTTEPLCSMKEKLRMCGGFAKCSRSHIANLEHVTTYAKGKLTMRSGREIHIASSFANKVRQAYLRAFPR